MVRAAIARMAGRARQFAGTTAGKATLGVLGLAAAGTAVAVGRKLFKGKSQKRSSVSRLRAQVVRNNLRILKIRSQRKLQREMMRV